MTKKFKPIKLLPVWIAVSAVIIVAGIILYALLGFNTAAERPVSKTFEVSYDVRVEVSERTDELEKACEDAFEANGLSFTEKRTVPQVSASGSDGGFSETSDWLLVYTFAAETQDTALEAARASVAQTVQTSFANARVNVAVHTLENRALYEAAWRAAVAVAVGAVVALIYMGIRFGVGSALTGLTVVAHDVLFTLAFFAITRIPVFAAGPALFAAVAAVASLVLWTLQCMKMRENFKTDAFAAYSAAEAVEESLKTSFKTVLCTGGAFAAALLVFGAVAASGVRLMVLPMLLPVGVALYSSLCFGPALHVHVKKAFDRIKAKRKIRYTGKQKAEKPVQE